jgi:hypothetical protein
MKPEHAMPTSRPTLGPQPTESSAPTLERNLEQKLILIDPASHKAFSIYPPTKTIAFEAQLTKTLPLSEFPAK